MRGHFDESEIAASRFTRFVVMVFDLEDTLGRASSTWCRLKGSEIAQQSAAIFSYAPMMASVLGQPSRMCTMCWRAVHTSRPGAWRKPQRSALGRAFLQYPSRHKSWNQRTRQEAL